MHAAIFGWNKKILIWILLAVQSLAVVAQIQTFTDKQGLSQNSIYAIAQDATGRIWVSTGDGLCNYDGTRFRSVSALNNDDFHRYRYPGNFVTDSAGNIWIGGLPGLFRISKDGSEFVNMTQKFGLDSNSITTVMSSDGPYIYILENGAWLLRYHIGSGQVDRVNLFKSFGESSQIYGIFGMGKISYIATDKGFFRRNELGNVRLLHASAAIPKLLQLRQGTLLYYDTVLWEFNVTNSTFSKRKLDGIQYLTELSGVCLNHDKLFISTRGNGVFVLNAFNYQLLDHIHAEDFGKRLPFNLIASVFVDCNRQLWVGTDGEGLVRLNLQQDVFRHKRISPVDVKSGENPNFIKCFYEDMGSGQIWIGTYSGTYQWNGDHPLQRKRLPGVEGNIVSFYKRDLKGRLWTATEKGVFIQPKEGLLFKRVPFPILEGKLGSDQTIYSIEISNHAIYFATKFGVARYNETENSIEICALPGYWIIYVYLDLEGNLWASKYQSDLVLLKPNQFDKPMVTSLARYNIRHVIYDVQSNRYLAASDNGLVLLRRNHTIDKTLNTENLLSSNVLYGILQDKKGRYWISSNKGIMCLDLRALKVRSFSASDGLQSQEYNTSAFLKRKNGEMLFGGINGFNSFEPDSAMKLKIHGEIGLLSSKVMNLVRPEFNHWEGQDLQLPFDSNTIELNFVLPDFIEPEDVRYFYKLGNETQTWISLGNTPRVFLANIKPGSYVVWVKAIDHFGVETPPKMLISFVILPPFYLTWWFLTLMAVLAAALVYSITRYLYSQKLKVALENAKRQQEVQQLRLNISRELHDNLGSSLSRVALLSHKMRQMPEKTNMADTADSISKLTQELNGQVRNIVWSLDHAYDNLEGLATYIRHFALSFLEENGIQANIDIALNMPEIRVRPDVRQVLYSVAKEALNNAVKYSQSNTIDVAFSAENSGDFILLIKDYGVGFDTTVVRNFSHGLKNMAQRTRELGFASSIQSAANQGTEVRIWGNFHIPLK